MLLNSFEFLIFFVIVFVLYWFVAKNHLKLQNALLLVASYFFYGWWDYRFLFLLLFSTGLDYYTGHKISKSTGRSRKTWLLISVLVNLGFLGFFKYYNFFVDSFAAALKYSFEYQPQLWTLNIILPVGISFYTFHGLSYVFDIYNKKVAPSDRFIDYAVFVSFFPLLVAGPIERATHLLPQVQRARVFEYDKAINGLNQIIWGLFKKIIIADNCGEFVNQIFENPSAHSGSTLALASVFFAFQIYCDFSGYSDIALGTARLLGIELLRNFAFPYFSRDIAEFWRRWHISLTSWFKDYLYIPLGGSMGSLWIKIRNTFIIFLASGFWHGANWTFIVWGTIHAIYFLPLLLFSRNRNNLETVAKGKLWPTILEFIQMITTFSLTTFAWIFFRASSIGESIAYIKHMFSDSLFTLPEIASTEILLFMGIFLVIEWVGREQQFAIANIGVNIPRPLKWAFYYAIILALFFFAGKERPFIYFQF